LYQIKNSCIFFKQKIVNFIQIKLTYGFASGGGGSTIFGGCGGSPSDGGVFF
jgi:hypothetical protein